MDSIQSEGGVWLVFRVHVWAWEIREGDVYLTTRACRSTGAPESTAAGKMSPGSLPFMTRFGTGENVDVP